MIMMLDEKATVHCGRDMNVCSKQLLRNLTQNNTTNLVVALEKKSGDHQSHKDSQSGVHAQNFMRIHQKSVERFEFGPLDRPAPLSIELCSDFYQLTFTHRQIQCTFIGYIK